MTKSGDDTKLYGIKRMRMNGDKLNTGMMRRNDMAKKRTNEVQCKYI